MIQDIILQKLKAHPEFRERSKRGKFLAILALREIKKLNNQEVENTQVLNVKELSDFAIAYASYERSWRDTLAKEENKLLRGTDYMDKISLEDKKLEQLGYK